MIQIVADSTADIPPALAQAAGIWVVPATVHFGTEVFRDGIDLVGDTFYRKLREYPTLPKTAAPAPAEFAALYRRAREAGSDVLSLHVSHKVSSTFNNAQLAAAEFGEHVAVVDSLTASMAHGLLALRAASAARSGATLAEARRLAEALVPRLNMYVAVDTLENLRRGGRIGHAAAFLGTMLNIKPIIAVVDGEVVPVERVRTLGRALGRIVELMREREPMGPVAVGYTDVPEAAQTIRKLIEQTAPGLEIITYQAGPAVGTHAGRGAVGLAFVGQPTGPARG